MKKGLRIQNSYFDEEIQDLIDGAILDLQTSGIVKSVASVYEEDKLIIRAISLYCKAFFGLENPDADKYERFYMDLKAQLGLMEAYTNDV